MNSGFYLKITILGMRTRPENSVQKEPRPQVLIGAEQRRKGGKKSIGKRDSSLKWVLGIPSSPSAHFEVARLGSALEPSLY